MRRIRAPCAEQSFRSGIGKPEKHEVVTESRWRMARGGSNLLDSLDSGRRTSRRTRQDLPCWLELTASSRSSSETVVAAPNARFRVVA